MLSSMMRSIAFVLALSTCVHTAQGQYSSEQLQALQAMPACGVACMETYIPQSSCSITDQHCLCTNSALSANLASCVQANCTLIEALDMTNSTAQLCDWPVRDRKPVIFGVTITFFVIATVFYLARMTARMPFFGGELGWDDFAISVAYLFTIGCTVVQLTLTKYGIGRDIWAVPHQPSDDQFTADLKLTTAYEETYLIATWFCKISVLLLYLRIFQDSKLRTWVKISIGFCAATLFALFISNIFHCWPIRYTWTFWKGGQTGSCASNIAPFWASAGLNIFGDLVVVFLPLPTIWNMTMSKSKRLRVVGMFSAGVIITIVSTARLSTIHVFAHSFNQTYDYVDADLYTIVEVDITVVCACLPGARNFYDRVICGRIKGKGQFATGPSRSSSAAAVQRHPSARSNSANSDASDATTLKDGRYTEEVIFVVKDVDIEERAMTPMSQARSWSNASYVEVWPTRIEE